ncbi:MAG: nucleotidyltransferase substrate binding protein [Leptospirales bacterium]
MEILNLEPLEKAIDQLKSGIRQSSDNPHSEIIRDGVIQRFEYTMDLSWKLLQRYLKHIAQIDESAIRTKNDLFREAARLRIVSSAEAWIGHYEARNETSHTYDSETAQRVFERAKLFLLDAISLLETLKHVT